MSSIVKRDGYSVCFSTLEEELASVRPEFRSTARRKLFTTSGCFSMFIDEQAIEAIKNLWAEGAAVALDPGFYVVIVKDFVETLSKEEVDAVILHEVGHVRHDHMGKVKTGEANAIDNILVNTDMELEADQFAVNYVGKGVMKSALEKIFHRTADLIHDHAVKNEKPFHKDVFLHQLYSDECIKARLAALS